MATRRPTTRPVGRPISTPKASKPAQTIKSKGVKGGRKPSTSY